MRIVLASGSPRRSALLAACGCDVVVCRPDVDETPRDGEPPAALVLRLARAKAATVRDAGQGDRIGRIVVAADTTVVLDGASLGKPADGAEATAMLRALSGRTHHVLTGWCARGPVRALDGVVSTEVTFRSLSDEDIALYVNTGEPLDKAGAYGIQGIGGALVDTVRGSYTNVVGLPLAEVLAAIRALS